MLHLRSVPQGHAAESDGSNAASRRLRRCRLLARVLLVVVMGTAAGARASMREAAIDARGTIVAPCAGVPSVSLDSVAMVVPAASHRWPMLLLSGYCVLIVAASLLGGWLPELLNLTHTRMQLLISLIGGLMLGIGVFHMLPHALIELGPQGPDRAALWMMLGLVTMFFLLRTFHFHHHGPADFAKFRLDEPQDACDHPHHHDHAHEHEHDHGHGHEHDHGHELEPMAVSGDRSPPAGGSVAGPPPTAAHQLSWLGVFFGLSLHTLIDGVALAASVQAEAIPGAAGLLGLGTFAAVLLHKPLDSVSITSLMSASHWSRRGLLVVNAAFALMCPLGAALFIFGSEQFAVPQSSVIGGALAFSAGVFLCIALSDLLPEMEFHSHNRAQLTAALLFGILLAWGIRFLEPSHVHNSGPQPTIESWPSPRAAP